MADKQFLYNDDLTFIGDMNCCPRKSDVIKSFCDIYDLKNLVLSPTCHKGNNPTLLDVILVSKPRRFAKTLNCECILSDFHNFVGAATKKHMPLSEPRRIIYRSYKNFDDDAPQPNPSPTLSLPPPTTSIPIPSSAYRASRSTCSPQWHHLVAEAAGGARVWGTTGSRRNHLTRSGRWLTRVMSRQLLLHVVYIYFVHDRDRPVTSGKVQWRPWKSGDNRESLVTPWEKVPWWQGLWMWVSPPSLQLKSLWLHLWATKNALRVAVAGRENIPPQNEDPALNEATTHSSRRRNRIIQPERSIQPARKCKQQRNPLLENELNDGTSNPDNHHSVPEPIAAPAQPGAFPSKVRIQWPRGNQSSAWARLDQELSTTLTMHLKGSTAKQLSAFCDIVHSLCLEKFGEEVKRKKSDGLKQPNRRQVKKGQLRAKQRQLKRQLKDAPQQEKIGIQVLLDDIKQEILVLSWAENHRKRRKKKRKTRESFYRNMPLLRSSSPQPRVSDLTSPNKTISERHIQTPWRKFHYHRWTVSHH